MSPIQDRIETLTDILANRIDEALLVSDGEAIIESLRDAWRTDSKQFTENDIRILQKTSRQLDALKAFLLEQEDFPDLATVENADEVIGRLYAILEHLDGLAVAARVHKEIRELIERKAIMPAESDRKKSAALARAMSRLTREAPLCKKCGSQMALRQGNGAYFWGFSTFPRCWSKQRLKPSELDQVS